MKHGRVCSPGGRRIEVVSDHQEWTDWAARRLASKQDSCVMQAARVLAVMALQSDRYRDEPDFRDAVDDVLELTKEVCLAR